MRKVYALLAVVGAFLFATTASAGTKNLYKQDFESSTDPAALGWGSPNLASGMSITGDSYGNYFQFSLGSNNGRNCYCLWGSEIYNDPLYDGTYHLELEWNYAVGSNNQYGTQLCVFTNDKSVQNNGNYINNANAQWLFALTEVDADRNFYINDDQSNTMIINPGTWLAIVLDVNENTRTVDWKIMDIFRTTTLAEGQRTVPEEWNMKATGLNQYNARYNSVVQMDNIMVQIINDLEIANPPTVALTGVNGKERTYTISFLEEEELYLIGTDGQEIQQYYMDCNGKYEYTTTTSGTLQAWTESGSAKSDVVITEVECVDITLPAATATISSVSEGYGKTYTINVSNVEVPTQPTIFIDYKFVNENGVVEASGEDKFSGETVAVSSKGQLTITTIAPGFLSNTVTIDNNREFEITNVTDFQHKTGEELLGLGFEQMDPLDSSTASGEGNWTARLRMNYKIATGETDEEGNPTYTTYVVYGPSESGYEPIQRYRYLQSKLNEETAHSLFAPVYTWYGTTGVTPRAYFEEDGVTPQVDPQGVTGGTTNLQIKDGIGLVFSGQVGDGEDFNPNSLSYAPILINYVALGVDGLTDDDFILVNKISDYGTTSVHPQFPAGTDPEEAKAQYKAMNLGGLSEIYTGLQTFQLYRVDTSITRITVYREKSEGIEEMNTGAVVSDHNAPVYNLNGMRVNPSSLQRGIYIKQGKKFVIK